MADLADQAQDTEAAHLRAALAAARGRAPERQTRDELDRVLCADCGEAIPEKRLRIVPDACRCVGCQEIEDAAC